MYLEKKLSDLNPGDSAKIKKLLSQGSMRRRLLDIGLIENTEVTCIGRSPCGDPTAFLIRGAVIAIRSKDCNNISTYPIHSHTSLEAHRR